MIFSNRYALSGVVLDTGEKFCYCKIRKKRTERYEAVSGFSAGRKYDYIETPTRLKLRTGYCVELSDEGVRGRINNFEEEVYNELQTVFGTFKGAEKVLVMELDTND